VNGRINDGTVVFFWVTRNNFVCSFLSLRKGLGSVPKALGFSAPNHFSFSSYLSPESKPSREEATCRLVLSLSLSESLVYLVVL
jgi:hypothetical protein